MYYPSRYAGGNITKSRKRRRQTTYRKRNQRTAGEVGVEVKNFSSARAAVALARTSDGTGGEVDPATLNCLFCPTQGTASNNRLGRRIKMRSIQITGMIQVPNLIDQTSLNIAPVVFIALVLDRQTNATQLNSEDVYTNFAASADMCVCPVRTLARSTRFKVLKQWNLKLDQTQSTWDGTNIEIAGTHYKFELFYKFKSRHDSKVEFIANGGTVADIQDVSLHMIAFTSHASQGPLIEYVSRVRFVD